LLFFCEVVVVEYYSLALEHLALECILEEVEEEIKT
jgi:hypothetical protein